MSFSCCGISATDNIVAELYPEYSLACVRLPAADTTCLSCEMKTDELREKYLTFFETKGCLRRPSDVLVPKDDPTVLFTPAGMNQFKNEFMGIGKP